MMRLLKTLTAAACLMALASVPGSAGHRDLGREVLAPNDGWAAAFDGGVTGGAEADADHTFVVRTRNELVQALAYPDATPKIIYIDGAIDANVDDDNQPLSCMDYYRDGYTLEAYVAAYDPAVWGTGAPSGPLENARRASAAAQSARVRIRVPDNTTIVGLDRRARIRGGWLDVRGSSTVPRLNVIIRNIIFEDVYDCFPAWSGSEWNAEYDAISLRETQRAWIDHNEFRDALTADSTLPTVFGEKYQVHDGLLDITNASDLVTVSWNRFLNHDKTMLIGSSDSAPRDVGRLRVTLHHNLFENVGQRAPRVRYGQVHLYNNLYRAPDEAVHGYSWGVGIHSKIYAENNYFHTEKSVTPDQFISVFKGVALYESGTLYNASSDSHVVDVLAAYNAVHGDPGLSADVGWVPTVFLAIDPAHRVPGRIESGAGPFNW